jgi:hypothetical protein
MFRVIKRFFDLEANHAYAVGDTFPHNGAAVSEDRLAELLNGTNKIGVPLIEEVKDKSKQSKKKQKI